LRFLSFADSHQLEFQVLWYYSLFYDPFSKIYFFSENYMFSRKYFSRERTFIVYHQAPSSVKHFPKFIFKFHFAETLKALWLLLSQDSLIIIALVALTVKHFFNLFYIFYFH